MFVTIFSFAYCGLVFGHFNSAIDGPPPRPPQLACLHKSFKFIILNPNAVTQAHETVLWN